MDKINFELNKIRIHEPILLKRKKPLKKNQWEKRESPSLHRMSISRYRKKQQHHSHIVSSRSTTCNTKTSLNGLGQLQRPEAFSLYHLTFCVIYGIPSQLFTQYLKSSCQYVLRNKRKSFPKIPNVK